MRHILLFGLLVISTILFSQQNNKYFYKVTYKQINNGEESKQRINIRNFDSIVYLSEPDQTIQSFINLKKHKIITCIQYNEQLYKVETDFDSLPEFKPIEKTEKILNHTCKAVRYSYFSNTIDVWYTENTKAKGSPYLKFLPGDNALVLKIVINGNSMLIADSIEKVKSFTPPVYLPQKATTVSKPRFEELKINSRFTKLRIFDNEQVYFDNRFKKSNDSTLLTGKVYHFSKGSVVLRKVKIPEKIKNSEYVIAELTEQSNGDAYDRTGSVFIIPASKNKTMMNAYIQGLQTLPVYTDKRGMEYQGFVKTNNYEPPVELISFFTPFGVGHFNNHKINNYPWANSVVYKQEVTKLIPNDTNEVIIGVFIGNYDKGGHKISLDLNFFPPAENSAAKKFIMPLFLTVNTMEMEGQNYGRLFKTDTLDVEFEITDTINNLELLFTTTGHGGWDTGDEFVQKLNEVFVDGQKVFSIVPWRTDCATYRLNNPASGNFSNGLSSSDISRSNWCPGTLTPPYVIPLKNIGIGKHNIKVVIHQGDDVEGSFNAWGISGILTGNYKSIK